jgi:hypothetical protein
LEVFSYSKDKTHSSSVDRAAGANQGVDQLAWPLCVGIKV